MSATSAPVATAPAHLVGLRDAASTRGLRVTQRRVVASEWCKLTSLRSSWTTLAAAVVVVVGLGALAAAVATGDIQPQGPGPASRAVGLDPTATSLAGASLAQVILGILGVLLVTGEYSTGTIRGSLAAVPRRLPVLWAKVVVVGGASVVVAVPASFAAFLLGQSVLGAGANVSLGDPGVLRAVLGTGVYLASIAVLGVAVGAVLRHAAGSIGLIFALLLVVPGLLVVILPAAWSDAVVKFLPSNAGASFTSVVPPDGMLSAGAGLAVLGAWVVVLLAAAAVLLRRRDA